MESSRCLTRLESSGDAVWNSTPAGCKGLEKTTASLVETEGQSPLLRGGLLILRLKLFTGCLSKTCDLEPRVPNAPNNLEDGRRRMCMLNVRSVQPGTVAMPELNRS